MRSILITLFTFILLVSCRQKKATGSNIDSLATHKDFIKITNPQDTLGDLISTIECKLNATKAEMNDGTDKFIHWISLENPNKDTFRLVDANEIVLPYSSVTLIIDYPLTRSASFELTSKNNNFTRKQIIEEISNKYQLVYKEEDSTTLIKVIPSEKREVVLNRNETTGKYGIWGHELSDLDLGSIQVYKNHSGKIYLILEVES